MLFPNAAKGINKIIAAEIISIVSAFFNSSFVLTMELLADEAPRDVYLLLMLIGSVALLLTFVLIAVTAVFALIGYYQASRDEALFSRSLRCAIAGGVLSAAGGFMLFLNGTLYTMFIAVDMVLDMFVIVYALTGLMNLSEQCGSPALVKRGDLLLKIITVTYFIAAVNKLVTRLFEQISHAKAVVLLSGAVDLAVTITQYLLYLSYLKSVSRTISQAGKGAES